MLRQTEVPGRRAFLLAGLAWSCSSTAQPRSSAPDSVAVYLVPMEDFPEEVAGQLARRLTRETGLWVKASLRIPAGPLAPLPGTNQYASEDILGQILPAARRLPETSQGTYYVVLTVRDINSRSQNFRFQFSSHNPSLGASVVSLARLLDYTGSRPSFDERAAARLYKLVKRAVGEVQLGWRRSGDPADLMYAPLMGLEDLDRIGLEHVER